MSYSSKLSVQRRGSWEPQFITSWSEVQVTMWTCNWHLKWRQSCGTEPLTCGIWCYFQVDGVRIMLSLGTSSQGLLKIEELGGGIGKHSSLKCCVFTYLFIYFLTILHVMWDLSSPIRDWTCAPCIGTVESEPPDGQWNSSTAIFLLSQVGWGRYYWLSC